MIDLERIDDLCQRLALGTMVTQLPHVAEEAVRREWSYQEFFERLLQAEFRERQERSRVLLTKTAGFPAIKTLDQYDFTFATGAPKSLLNELASLTFIERAENVVLLVVQAALAKRISRLRSDTSPRKPASRPASFPPPTSCCSSQQRIGRRD